MEPDLSQHVSRIAMFAYLILAHAHPQQLARLVRALRHPDAHFYIHLDAKSPEESFREAVSGKDITYIGRREKVAWGAYSLVQATLNGFAEIIRSQRPYSYVHLLSGQDYPLVSHETMASFFEVNPGKQYMEFYPVEDVWTEAIPRIRKYHFVNFDFPGKFMAERMVNAVMPARKMPDELTAVGRSQWFSITPEAIRYIQGYLGRHPEVVRFFRLTWGVDELIFQTLLYNSPFRDSLVNDNLRYIDWSEGKASPKTLTQADWPAMQASGKFFARKFTENDEVLDRIDQSKLHP